MSQEGIKVRLAAPQWANFTGSMGFGAKFKNGVSIEPLSARHIARIASSTRVVDNETGEQIGPSVTQLDITRRAQAPVIKQAKTLDVVKQEEKAEAEVLAKQAAKEKAEEEAALAEAQAKLEAETDDELVIYSRQELEAIGHNDGVAGLRPIGDKLDVKGRAISDLIDRILEAQAEAAE